MKIASILNKEIGLNQIGEMEEPAEDSHCRPMYETVKNAMEKSGTLHAAVFFGEHFRESRESIAEETLAGINTLLVVKNSKAATHRDFHKNFVRGLWDAGVRGGIAAMTKKDIDKQGGIAALTADQPNEKVSA